MTARTSPSDRVESHVAGEADGRHAGKREAGEGSRQSSRARSRGVVGISPHIGTTNATRAATRSSPEHNILASNSLLEDERAPAKSRSDAGGQRRTPVDDDQERAGRSQTAREKLAEERHVKAPPGACLLFSRDLDALSLDVDDVGKDAMDSRSVGCLEFESRDRVQWMRNRTGGGRDAQGIACSYQVHIGLHNRVPRWLHACDREGPSEFA
jgi:hypothetical protein